MTHKRFRQVKFSLRLPRAESAPKLLSGRHRLFRTTVVVLALAVVWLLVYRNFIFGDNTLLYKDVGIDSINISYPYYVLLSDYLRHVGIPSWSFQVGMGQSLFPNVGTVVLTPVVWLAKGIIAKALVYQHLLYIVISGILFARFLTGCGLTFGSCLLGALLLSFSAYMCMGSCWYFHANEVVCFTFLLFATEEAVGRGHWSYLVLAVAVVGLLGAFHLYLCALLLCFYVPLRLVDRYSWRPWPIARASVLLAAAAVLGVGLGAIVGIDNFFALLNSPRGSGPTSLVGQLSSKPIFGLESSLHYMTAVLRPFGNDLMGTGNDFRGWQNYLEAPMTYCGLLSLVIFPQIFVDSTLRHRLLYGLFFAVVVLATLFPWFRCLFWVFQGDYYRTLSLFAIFGIITLGMTAFSRYSEGHPFNLWLLVSTILVLIAVLFLPIREFQARITPALKWAATIFLVSYGVLLLIGQLLKQQKIVAWMIIGLVAIELLHFDRITITRPTVTKQELKERVGYNDETVDAVQDINANDKSFFRIRKTWGSGRGMRESLNDAMVFGYYGTSSYSSFNNLNYIKFLMAVGAISESDLVNDTRWSYGLLEYPLLSTFACEKYVLTNNPAPFEKEQYYEFVKRYGNEYLFRNRLFLPFGLSFGYYITEDMFLQLPQWAKPLALLHAAVLTDKDAADELGLSQLTMGDIKYQAIETSLPDIAAKRRSTALNIRSFRETRIEGTIQLNQRSVLVLQTPFDPGWQAFEDGRAAHVLKADLGLLGVVLNVGEHTVELRYRPPFLYAGAAVSLVSLLIFAATLWQWPRIRLSQ
jgi:hypothetical protein